MFVKQFDGAKLPAMTIAPGFEERIRLLMKLAGSQRALARAIGVVPGTISAWLAGSEPFVRTLHKIADTLGISREWLVAGEGEPPQAFNDEANRLNMKETPAEYGGPMNLPSDSSAHLLSVLETVSRHMNPSEIARAIPALMDNLKVPQEKRREAAAYLSEILGKRLKQHHPPKN